MKLISSKRTHRFTGRGVPVSKTTIFVLIGVAAVAFILAVAAFFGISGNTQRRIDSLVSRINSARATVAVKSAEYLALTYDYDGAIEMLSEFDSEEANALLSELTEKRSTLKAADNYAIPHIFFHSLIADTSKAFDGDTREAGYNQVMTTVEEFRAMLNQMYERGYVLVSIHDIAGFDENGNTVMKEILLPEGKRPFVLSVDDVCYYEYMEGDGFASRIVVGDDGKPTCEMKNDDGTVSRGEFDVVPILDKFIEKHPDFSYRGARGILAFTGYNGVLGYRTCPSYSDNPTYSQDVEAAKAVAKCLRENGWEFASHSWGHRNMGTMAMEHFKTDTNRWEEEVETIIGETDILIFPFGADIESWKNYSDTNERFKYLKGVGFNYFCNVDGNRAWLQVGKNYVRQGRRNLDGYRMYYDMINDNRDWLSDLFDVNEVFDKSRPLPVPPMG